MKKILATLFAFSIMIPILAFAAGDYGAGKAAQTAGLTDVKGDVTDILGNVIGTALTFVGVLFFILMVYAGILWMTSRGNTDQADKALHTITAAIIGLILVIASYAITSFVFKSTTRFGGGDSGGGESGLLSECLLPRQCLLYSGTIVPPTDAYCDDNNHSKVTCTFNNPPTGQVWCCVPPSGNPSAMSPTACASQWGDSGSASIVSSGQCQ